MSKIKSQVKCLNCSKDFQKLQSEIKRSKTGKHFCSRSCAAKRNNIGVQRNPPKPHNCKICNKVYFHNYKHRRTVVCSDCSPNNKTYSDVIKELSIKEYRRRSSLKGKHPSWKHASIRNFCRSWNRHLQNHSCQNCGYSKHIEFCHIKPISSFSDETKLKVVNSPDNLLILCRNCHWEYDHDLLELKSIPQRI